MTGAGEQRTPQAFEADFPNGVREAARRIEGERTRKKNRPLAFTEEASTKLVETHSEYLGDLGCEAIRLARRNNFSTVDPKHITEARERIETRVTPSPIGPLLMAFGGILGGIAFASIYAISYGPGPHEVSEYLFALISAVLATLVLTLGSVWSFKKT